MGEAKPCLCRRPRLDVGLINFDVPAGEKTKDLLRSESYERDEIPSMDSDVM